MLFRSTNCFKYELFEYPFVHNFRKNIRFFADCGVKGVFNEGMHREHEEADFAVTYELRSYLLAKLMWNPYMSEAEFQHHMEEFCHAFYGEGYYFIIHYLKLFEDYSGECAGYDALKEDVVMGEGNECRASPVIRKEQAGYFAEKANALLDKALLRAKEEQVKRIQKLKTVVLYYELFWTMRNILDHGSRQERQTVITKNEELIQRIFDQKLVITFWGQSRESQNKELETMREIPPSEWNYKW